MPKQKRKQKGKKKANPWMEHLGKVKMENPKKSYKDCMVLAKKSYKPMK